MATPPWQAGKLYQPGALVQPASNAPIVRSGLENPSFEDADGWTFELPTGLEGLIEIVPAANAFHGAQMAYWHQPLIGKYAFVNNAIVPVSPGQVITAKGQHGRETNNTLKQGSGLSLIWYGADNAVLSRSDGPWLWSGSNKSWIWYELAVTGTAPAKAAFVQLQVTGENKDDGGNHGMRWDAFSWDYAWQGPPAGMIYRAVQAASGFSGSEEPAWPPLVGQTVIDNEVTWEAVLTSRVVWEAKPILVSGAVEPVFPDEVGGTVIDGTIIWKAVSRMIEDAKAPHSKVVAIASSKVYAADEDIIGFCATINPLDWSTAEDAGYLPFGLQTYGANPVQALGLYRSNLVAFNAAAFQMWQVDQDPANMALLDAIPIGSTYPKTVQPVSNDLAFLTALGLRSFGVAAASANLQAGDFGKAIDPLVQAAIRELEEEQEPFGLYYPAQGQYWVFFGAEAFVLTMNGDSRSWSRYLFPEEIVHWTVLGDDLYLRTITDKVWRISEQAIADDVGPITFHFTAGESGSATQVGYVRDAYDGTPAGSLGVDYDGVGPFVLHKILHRISEEETLTFSLGSAEEVAEEIFDHIELLVDDVTYLFAREAAFNSELQEDAAGAGGPESRWRREWSWFASVPLVDGQEYEITIANVRGSGVGFDALIWWPYLEMGAVGGTRMMYGFDLCGEGEVAVSFGYDQSDFDLVTPEFICDAETLVGNPVPMPLAGPSFQMRLRFTPFQKWRWESSVIYLEDLGVPV